LVSLPRQQQQQQQNPNSTNANVDSEPHFPSLYIFNTTWSLSGFVNKSQSYSYLSSTNPALKLWIHSIHFFFYLILAYKLIICNSRFFLLFSFYRRARDLFLPKKTNLFPFLEIIWRWKKWKPNIKSISILSYFCFVYCG
jgi:hypothetical protein